MFWSIISLHVYESWHPKSLATWLFNCVFRVTTKKTSKLWIAGPLSGEYISDCWIQNNWGCFTNVSWALRNNLAKMHNIRNHIYDVNIKLKLWTCAQSMALGTRTKFKLEILIRSRILHYTNFEIIFWRTRKTFVKHLPVLHKASPYQNVNMESKQAHKYSDTVHFANVLC